MPRFKLSWPWLPRFRRNYSLYDSFSVDAAAGSVNGTFSDKSHSLRTVTDTENKLSVSGGKLVFAGGKAVPEVGDPSASYPAVPRVAGKVILWTINLDSVDAGQLRFGANYTNADWNNGIFLNGGGLGIGAMPLVDGITASTDYQIAFVLRETGHYLFFKGGAIVNWTCLFTRMFGNDSTVAFWTINYDRAFTAADIRIPKRLWLPEPIAYDAFTRGDGALGVSDIVGPDGQACVSRAWAFPAGTWAISTNKAVGTPTLGDEKVTNGNMETGDPPTGWSASTATLAALAPAYAGAQSLSITSTGDGGGAYRAVTLVIGSWYQMSLAAKAIGGDKMVRYALDNTGIDNVNAVITSESWVTSARTGRATDTAGVARVWAWYGSGTVVGVDDISVKPLTPASLFSSVTDSRTSDVIVDVKVAALTAGTQAGGVACLDSATDPTKGIPFYFDGSGNIKCDEFTAANTWTNLISAAKAFTAGDTLRLHKIGTAIRLYHITDAGVATLIGTSTATANTNTKHGMFNTSPGTNQMTSCQVFPAGSGNEFAALDSL